MRLAQAIGTPRALGNPPGNEAFPILSREQCSLFSLILSPICFQKNSKSLGLGVMTYEKKKE